MRELEGGRKADEARKRGYVCINICLSYYLIFLCFSNFGDCALMNLIGAYDFVYPLIKRALPFYLISGVLSGLEIVVRTLAPPLFFFSGICLVSLFLSLSLSLSPPSFFYLSLSLLSQSLLLSPLSLSLSPSPPLLHTLSLFPPLHLYRHYGSLFSPASYDHPC